MALHEAVLEPYRHRGPGLAVALTAGIVFLENVVVTWQTYHREVFDPSVVESAVLAAGSFVVEPLLLFGALYYVGTRSEWRSTLVALLPGLVAAAFVGNYVGQSVGGELWVLGHGFVWLAGIDYVGVRLDFDLMFLAYVVDAVDLVARDVLTAVAALALARERQAHDRGESSHGSDDAPPAEQSTTVRG